MPDLSPMDVIKRYHRAKERRKVWEAHWQECYDYTLPQRGNISGVSVPGEKKMQRLFDGTAPDAVDQLAASLLAHLTPPWARWFGLTFGNDVTARNRAVLAPELETMATVLQAHFDRANFAVEMHQCFLDLVTIGTASLLLEEAPIGHHSAFRFTSVPLSQVVVEQGESGCLDTTYRRRKLSVCQIKARFPDIELSKAIYRRAKQDSEFRLSIIEAVVPQNHRYDYFAVLDSHAGDGSEPKMIGQGTFAQSPYINFRWLKAPGESYGRSPVMKALPDIKTANKVVELILKNASIAVTGIWQADDDGVLNPATISLTPGTIIPKAVGSAGLTPLETPGRFDTSQIVLDKLRNSIRSALLADKLGQISDPHMTATEVLERATDIARLLGATYGRLQSELLSPLVIRAQAILRRRGEIANLRLDGRTVELQYRSPLARDQSHKEAQDIIHWLEALTMVGPKALAMVDVPAVVHKLGQAFGISQKLMVDVHMLSKTME